MIKFQEIVKDREPGVLQSMGSQRVRHGFASEQQHKQTRSCCCSVPKSCLTLGPHEVMLGLKGSWPSPVASLTTRRTSLQTITESMNSVSWVCCNLETDALKFRNVNPHWVNSAVSTGEPDMELCTLHPKRKSPSHPKSPTWLFFPTEELL